MQNSSWITSFGSFLQITLPLIVCGLSATHLLIITSFHTRASSEGGTSGHTIYQNDITQSFDFQEALAASVDEHPRFHNGETYSKPGSISSGWILWLKIVECVAVAGELILSGLALPFHAFGSISAAVATIGKWAYVLCVLLAPATFGRHAWFSTLLRQHRACVYAFSWVFSAMLVRSLVIDAGSWRQFAFQVSDLCLTSLLLLLSIFSQKKHARPSDGGRLSSGPIASLFSLATFTWVDPIIWQGYRRTCEISDVWDLPLADTAVRVLANSRRSRKNSGLAAHLLREHGPVLFLQCLWAVCAAIFTFAPTLLLRLILEYLEDSPVSSSSSAWLYVFLILLSGFLKAIAEGQASWLGTKTAIHVRAIVVSEIFAKSLKRKATADNTKGDPSKDLDVRNAGADGEITEYGAATTGKITNIMAVDSAKIVKVSSILHLLWASVPAELIIGIALLYGILGYASIAGLAIMIVLIPIKIVIARGFSKIQAKIMSATDARIQTTGDLLQNLRLFKYFAYEDRVAGDVQEKRAQELESLRIRFTLWTLAITLYNTTPVLITLFSFLIYTIVEDRTLKPSVAFPALSIFALLRIPLDRLAGTIASVQEAMVSIGRVEKYLEEDETDKYRQYYAASNYSMNNLCSLQNASLSWHAADMKAFKLDRINLGFPPAALNVIMGPTGSGKTSLLLAMVGELDCVGGKVYYAGNVDLRSREPGFIFDGGVAYCAQRSWLMNDTIKQNIVFGSPRDEERYSAVIEACALRPDLHILPNGDNSLVGERGIKLSGGQKQRIALARAAYSKARHVLLDDCLSAIDSGTAKWIMERCIMGKLMQNRTCLLVTHNTALALPNAKYVALLSKGRVAAKGSPNELGSSNSLLGQTSTTGSSVDSPSHPNADVSLTDGFLGKNKAQTAWEMDGQVQDGDKLLEAESPESLPFKIEVPRPEAKATGSIKWANFSLYFTAFGRWYYWVAMTLMFFVNQVSGLSIDFWIREWASSYRGKNVPIKSTADIEHLTAIEFPVQDSNRLYNFPTSRTSRWFHLTAATGKADTGYYLTIYAVLALVFMIFKAIRMGLLFLGSLSASRKVHDRLLKSITRASFQFYDATPYGQIINRFSRDLEILDQELAPILLGLQHAAFSALTIWLVISITTPLFILPSLLVVLLYFIIGKLYIHASRDLKRIESLQRSPLYDYLDEILSGVVTIRAYGHETRFFQGAQARLDTYSKVSYSLSATTVWFAFRVDVTSALISFLAGAFVVVSAGKISPAAAGLSLTSALTFTEHIMWLVQLYALNEQNMNS